MTSGLWSLYNTIRYFIAYTIYESLQGQIAAIVLGSSAAVCLTFLICAAILSIFRSYLIRAHIPIHSLLILRTVFLYLGSFFLISPAIVNIALAIVWRNSSIPELVPQLRCHLDIDVVWSVTTGTCNRTTAAQWLGLAIFRVAFTLIIIVSLNMHLFLTSSLIDGLIRFYSYSFLLPTTVHDVHPKHRSVVVNVNSVTWNRKCSQPLHLRPHPPNFHWLRDIQVAIRHAPLSLPKGTTGELQIAPSETRKPRPQNLTPPLLPTKMR